MKAPWEWEEEGLLELIKAGTQESIDLEYKRCDALGTSDGKKREISKDVSAFANSAGGTIVYGMIEDGHVPTGIDEGYDPQDISKEWLEQVINSTIHRRIEGIRIKQIDLPATSPGKVAYVVHVPQSVRAPHQAADKRFYKRFNFQSIPMEEYEIRDISHRSEAPDLRVEMLLGAGDVVPLTFAAESSQSSPFEIKLRVTNEASTPAEEAVFLIGVDARLEIADSAGLADVGTATLGATGLRRFQKTWTRNSKIAIIESLPPLPLTDRPLTLAVLKSQGPEVFAFHWEAHSPRMSRKQGVVRLLFDGSTVRLLQAD